MTNPVEPKITVADCALPACTGMVSGGVTPTPVELVIQPDPGIVNVGGKWNFKASVKFSDNTTADVTDSATWDSSSLTVASVAAGVAAGEAIGTATIGATYQGLQAFAQLTVVAVCVDTGTEIVVCLARDRGMSQVDSGSLSRIALVGSGVQQLISSLRTTDKLAITSYAGSKLTDGNGGATYNPEATTESPLTSDKTALLEALDNYVLRGPCNPSATLSVCEIGIGGGLAQALAEANGDNHTLGQKRVIVLVVDGRDAVGIPDAASVAGAIKDDGILLMIIGIAIPDDYNASLAAMASHGLYFQASASACAGIIARVPNMFCYYGELPAAPTYSGPARVRIASYADTLFRVCRFATAKRTGSTVWDGTLVYNRITSAVRGTGLFFSDNVGSVETLDPKLQSDPSKHSIHGKALLLAQLVHYSDNVWALEVFSINDAGEPVRLWVGQRVGDVNTPQGVYRIANSGGDAPSNCYPDGLSTVTIETF